MSPNDPEPILRPSLYLFPTRSSILFCLNGLVQYQITDTRTVDIWFWFAACDVKL